MQNLLQQFNLGNLVTPPEQITLGCSHQLYKVTTDQGVFAVKQLDRAVVNFLGGIEQYYYRDNLLMELEQQGVPAVASIGQDSDIFVYPWIDGKLISLDKVTELQAYQVGKVLAKIHQVNIGHHQLNKAPWQFLPISQASWSQLLQDQSLVYLAEGYEEIYRAGLAELDQLKIAMSISHGDLNYLNIIWLSDHEVRVIDWESLGLAYPYSELWSMALCWSGFITGHYSDLLFQAVMQGYEEVIKVPVIITATDKKVALGYWLIWLKFCLYRSQQLLPCSLELGKVYEGYAKKTWNILQRVYAEIDSKTCQR